MPEANPIYVAAPAGQEAIVLFIEKTRDDDRPTEARIRTERRPVVAWRIQPASGPGNDDRATPVLSRAAYHDQLVLISLSDGGWISAAGTNYSSLDEATAETLAMAQTSWDRRRNAQEPADR